MSDYSDREAAVLYHELKYVYPELAPPDERTPKERKKDAEQAKDELFGLDEDKEEASCLLRD